MIYLIGGNGYVGTNFIQQYENVDDLLIVDPMPPAQTKKIGYFANTAAGAPYDERCKCLVWLAGPRNSGSPREVAVAASMIEQEFRQVLKSLPAKTHVVLFSSMSIYDNDHNPYANHKKNMERILEESRRSRTIIRPGTIIGAVNDEHPVLRSDLAVHKILNAVVSNSNPRVNGAVHRAYATIDTVLTALFNAVCSHRRDVIEAYDSLSGMPALFSKLPTAELPKLSLFWDDKAPSYEGEVRVYDEGLLLLQIKVLETFLRLQKGIVNWL